MSAPTLPSATADVLSQRRRLLVLAICCASILVVVMDISIVNVALPAIGRDLHATESGLQWTVDAYTLVLASFLVLAGSTADRVGRRRVFQVGLAAFGIGSLLCGLAPGIGALVAARAVQAVGGTMLNPVAMAIVANTFPDPAERARAIGVFGSVSGLALALGPILGGGLVEAFGWRAVFWVNVPIVVVAIVCTKLFVPESRAARARRFDPAGQALMIGLLGSIVFAIIEAKSLGWTSPAIGVAFIIALLSAAGILGYEARRADPLLELRLFRSVPFSAAIGAALGALCAFGAFLFVTTQYLQDVRGMSALMTGLCLLPVGLLVVLLSARTGRLVGSRGPRLPLVISGAALATGGLASTWLGPATPLPAVLAVYALFGVFLGTINPPITNSAVAGMPRSMAGVAASLASAGRQTGTTLGVAISGAIIASAPAHGKLAGGLAAAHGKLAATHGLATTHSGLAAAHSGLAAAHSGLAAAHDAAAAAFTSAERGVWWMALGLGIVICVLGLASTGRRALRTAARAAALFAAVDAAAVDSATSLASRSRQRLGRVPVVSQLRTRT